ncbi:hypothetical protein B0T19DRAFT_133810 [Cercophora scortea]|uniref:Uncharacterized protein n=1 Tax=Cercophora scortea TaxID=314031 RepID=A0AAE0IZ29_9PEZI|nr:hypothetical protein B0T19DRAFT_133810 [Cercophora scortea]
MATPIHQQTPQPPPHQQQQNQHQWLAVNGGGQRIPPAPATTTSALASGKLQPTREEDPSRLSDGTDDGDDDFYGDQDDVQSFIQPAISPMATRLTLPKTPAAERAAAMDKVPEAGFFDMFDPGRPSPPSPPIQSPVPQRNMTGSQILGPTPPWGPAGSAAPRDRSWTMGQNLPSPPPALPTPWRAGPKQLIITDPAPSKTSMSGALGAQARHQRSSSISENALKRLSKALPSMPSMSSISIPTPSFFLSTSSQKEGSGSSSTAQKSPSSSSFFDRLEATRDTVQNYIRVSPLQTSPPSLTPESAGQVSGRPPSRSYTLRKSTSDDSLLYHSLSRVSSLGDDDRFVNIREQVNSRFKAIKDSWDGPSFKMPQFPSILNAPLKKTPALAAERQQDEYRSSSLQINQRMNREGVSPLDSILESLTGDIVIMGGYRGSILRSARPPYRQLWVPVKVGLNIRKVNMEVGLDPEDEETMEQRIFASGMLQNIGPVDISKRLFKKLRECENARKGKLRVHDYGYDWRLSPHLLSRRLAAFLEKLPSNQANTPSDQRGAWVISHSLGGVITRHVVNQRPELFAGVVYAGAPQRCINILGPIRNGDAVLLNEKVLTAQVHFSLRTTFVFLPEDGFCFIDKATKEEYPIDYYNVDDWIKYRLSPCIGGPVLPPLTRSNTFTSLLSLSDSLPSLPLRGRAMSQHYKKNDTHRRGSSGEPAGATAVKKDRTLAPQLGASSASGTQHQHLFLQNSPTTAPSTRNDGNSTPTPSSAVQARNLAYLRRTLAETKKFRSELVHNPKHQEANAYPPLAIMYAKDIPTVYAARVAGREGIACADAYDDLVFRSGDGVVLAKEAMLPEGYELVKGGRICTDRGHVTMLGDLVAVGRALESVVRGRRKGIGMGTGTGTGGA